MVLDADEVTTLNKMLDLHIHGIDGFDTRSPGPEIVLRIAEIEGHAGVAGIVLSIYSAPIDSMRQQMAVVRRAMERQSLPSNTSHSYPSVEEKPGMGNKTRSARILGVHLEGPFLNPTMAGALDSLTFLEPSERGLRQLIDGFEDMIRIVTIAPEREGALGLIRSMAKVGILVNMGHSNATFLEAEAGFLAGARGITHLFNGMAGFHHREPGLCGFGLLNSEIYVEVIGDGSHLSRETLDLVFRTKRPDRIILVSDSVKETSSLSDRAPPTRDGRLLGGSMTVPEAARCLVIGGLDEEIVMKATTTNPEAFLGSAR
jgi:N-acetylglucosamine-6-phosphate deacetylase